MPEQNIAAEGLPEQGQKMEGISVGAETNAEANRRLHAAANRARLMQEELQIRQIALQIAASLHPQNQTIDFAHIFAAARVFEAYLRGEDGKPETNADARAHMINRMPHETERQNPSQEFKRYAADTDFGPGPDVQFNPSRSGEDA